MNMMIDMADNAQDSIAKELHAWLTTGLRIAIWGSADESAAFLETHGLDARRFLVPGTGQVIRSPDWLLDPPVGLILILCSCPAAAIARQIDAARLPYEALLRP